MERMEKMLRNLAVLVVVSVFVVIISRLKRGIGGVVLGMGKGGED